MRRSRGYAPRPLAASGGGTVLLWPSAVDLKNTLCLGSRAWDAWFSPHLGDMGDMATLGCVPARGKRPSAALSAGITPECPCVFDRHPGYHPFGRVGPGRQGGGLRLLQRAAPPCAHRRPSWRSTGHDGGYAPVIGVAFYGTCYGADGAVWGGEVLLAGYAGFRRAAHLAPVPCPAGTPPSRPAAWRSPTSAPPAVRWETTSRWWAACPVAELWVLARQLHAGF